VQTNVGGGYTVSVWEGLIWLFLKVGLLAVVIMIAIWVISLIVLRLPKLFK
jgi:hypothetical protein